MPDLNATCTLCILIRCLHFTPKITIRRKCTYCNRIWIVSWSPKYKGSHIPRINTVWFGVCPQGQKIVTESILKCSDCLQREYAHRKRHKGVMLKESP